MRTQLLVATCLITACAHKDQIKETTPTATTTPPVVAKTETPPATTTPPTTASPPEVSPSLTPVYFGFDEAVLSAADQGVLQRLGDWLSSHKSAALTISGHADERGTVEYNLALGDRRATAAAEYLRRLGVDANRLKTISYGKLKPAVDGHDEESWAKNRRDEFELSPGWKQANK